MSKSCSTFRERRGEERRHLHVVSLLPSPIVPPVPCTPNRLRVLSFFFFKSGTLVLICKISFLSFHVPLYGMHSSAPCLQACSMWICSIVLSDSQSAPRAKEPEAQSRGRKKKNLRNPRVVWSLPARSSKLRQSYGVGSLPVFYSFKFQKSSEKTNALCFVPGSPTLGLLCCGIFLGTFPLFSKT